MLIVAVMEYFNWGKEQNSFWNIKLIGILAGLVLISVAYYTYTGISGIKADWLNITIFFLAAAAVFWLEIKLFKREFSGQMASRLAIALIGLIAILFTVFTFVPPHIPFFQDPITGTYGF